VVFDVDGESFVLRGKTPEATQARAHA
jgi:hypothetical protein